MENITTRWRPLPQIRTKALGIARRVGATGDELLACAITNDAGDIKGWRPLGGSIDFVERAADTVLRELKEEIFATATIIRRLGVVENIYDHHGERGHEIVYLYDVNLIDAGLAAEDRFVVVEDNGARCRAGWVPVSQFTSGSVALFPDGLLDLL